MRNVGIGSLFLGLVLLVASCKPSSPGQPTPTPTSGQTGPLVVLMIGDGMGLGQTKAASLFAYGETGELYMESLPLTGEITTSSMSGTTDSAAAATAMATGELTYNARIGQDRAGQAVETVVEWAKSRGMSTAVVSTALLPHATPAGFSAHEASRHDYLAIADDQALRVQPDVMLGGGAAYFRPAGADSYRSDDGLLRPLEQAGYTIVTDREELSAVDPATTSKVVGLFAPEHMAYTVDRPSSSVQPTLTEMSLAALELVDGNPEGALVVIEGARIDMAGHLNDLERNVTETVAFDEAIQAVDEWIGSRDDASLLVTADHECGGLRVLQSNGAGTLPDVEWRWGQHTNANIRLRGRGPAAEMLADRVVDHRWVHAAIQAALDGGSLQPPPDMVRPDGHMRDLRHLAVEQVNPSGFGEGFNQLDALYVDADDWGLGLGVEGVFSWGTNAVLLWIDVDYGASTGPARLEGAFDDTDGIADAIVSGSSLDAPGIPGFGADFVVVGFGGSDPRAEDLLDTAGLRGLHAPYGDPVDLAWYGVATNYGEHVRTEGEAIQPTEGEGYEVEIPWSTLYPDYAGGVPANAEVAVFAVIVNDDGGFTSNQALPPFAPGTDNPGRDLTPIPGLVRFTVDSDGDGVADGDAVPVVVAP